MEKQKKNSSTSTWNDPKPSTSRQADREERLINRRTMENPKKDYIPYVLSTLDNPRLPTSRQAALQEWYMNRMTMERPNKDSTTSSSTIWDNPKPSTSRQADLEERMLYRRTMENPNKVSSPSALDDPNPSTCCQTMDVDDEEEEEEDEEDEEAAGGETPDIGYNDSTDLYDEEYLRVVYQSLRDPERRFKFIEKK